MTKRKNNIGGLLDSLKSDSSTVESENTAVSESKIVNPAVNLAINSNVKRATSIKEPVLHLSHDQVRFFKYHDRHESSIDTIKVHQIRRSIESEGQHFPGIVRKTSDITTDGRVIYDLIVGRLRFEASRSVGIFKAFLKDVNDIEAAKLMFSENEDRQDITPFERWLSIIPIVKDNVLESQDIARLIGWDKGNLSRSMKAIDVYDDCVLHDYLLDVAKVKLGTLIDVATSYNENPKAIKDAISFVEDKYPDRKNNLFLKSILKRVTDIKTPETETLFLSGSKVKIKRVGDSLNLSFSDVPLESDFNLIIAKLKEMKAVR